MRVKINPIEIIVEIDMAVKTKKIRREETPSERFERIMQKITRRQRLREERRQKRLQETSDVCK